MRSALVAGSLSLLIALIYVDAADLGPKSASSLQGPFANLHGGYPTGLPNYGKTPNSGVSTDGITRGSFEGSTSTNDAPAEVLAFYRRSIDPAIWTITSKGSRWLLFHYTADPAIRGGVEAYTFDKHTAVYVWATDFLLPQGFPVEFPAPLRARPAEAPHKEGDTYVLRWEVRYGAEFVEDFSRLLMEAGWDVAIAPGRFNVPSLTCRSRAQPTLGCRLALTLETIRKPSVTYQTGVAAIHVGPGADR